MAQTHSLTSGSEQVGNGLVEQQLLTSPLIAPTLTV